MRLDARSAAPLALLTVGAVAASMALTGPALAVAPPDSVVFINEIHYDNTGTDAGEAIEVAAPAGTDLTGWSLVLYNGATGATYDTDALAGVVPGAPGSFGVVVVTYPSNGIQNGAPDAIALVGPAGVEQFLSYEGAFAATNGPAVGLTSTDIGVDEEGTDAAGNSLALTGTGTTYGDFVWQAPATSSFGSINPGQIFGEGETDLAPAVTSTNPPNGDFDVPVDMSVTVAFSEPVDVTADSFTLACTNSGAHAVTVTGGPSSFSLDPATDFGTSESCTLTVTASAVTDQDVVDPPDTMAADYTATFTTAGPGGPICAVSPAITPIHTVQGTTDTTPCATKVVTVEGVVVGDYEGPSPALRGFYVQEQDAEVDADPATSEGIFVFNGNNDTVSLGQVVAVTGTANEFQGQTQISATTVTVGASGQTVTPAVVTLPLPSATHLEQFEGMLVVTPQTLTVTEHFQLGRFGEIVVSSDGRLAQPTNVVEPGADAQTLQAANNLNRLKIDDALQNQNPDPIVFGRSGDPLTAENTLRGGDTVTGVVGVMTYTWAGFSASGNAYRLRPVGDLSDSGLVAGGVVPDFEAANPRPTGAPEVGGSLQVAAFNVLNYFLTLDDDVNQCGPDGFEQGCRGANDEEELQRQRTKLLEALLELDADVLGIVEVENSTGVEPLADIVAGLNAAGTATYDYIETGTVGTDAIKVGLIYQPGSVTPLGDEAVLDKSVDPRFDSDNMRPSLAQSFTENATGEVFTVVVNHLKSKGCGGSAGLDADQGDGQGCFNATRTAAAQALRDWIATQPTGVQDDDVLIVGDLNSYAKEDPIDVLVEAGFVDLAALFTGDDAYSYVFDGQWGYLDYALASQSLVEQVTDAEEYHINADEPGILDYNTDFKSDAQVDYLYAPDEFRTSDHDPVLVGLALDGLPGVRAIVRPATIREANGAYRTVRVIALGPTRGVTTVIESVTSSEPDCEPGFGDLCDDIVQVNDRVLKLRAESFGPERRTYTIVVSQTDGNQTVFTTLTVTVRP